MALFNSTRYSPLPNTLGDIPRENIEMIGNVCPSGSASHFTLDIPIGETFDSQLDLLSDSNEEIAKAQILKASREILLLATKNFPHYLSPKYSPSLVVVDVHCGDMSSVFTHAKNWHLDGVISREAMVGVAVSENPTLWLNGKYQTKKHVIKPTKDSSVHTFESKDDSLVTVLGINSSNVHKRPELINPSRILVMAGVLPLYSKT